MTDKSLQWHTGVEIKLSLYRFLFEISCYKYAMVLPVEMFWPPTINKTSALGSPIFILTSKKKC